MRKSSIQAQAYLTMFAGSVLLTVLMPFWIAAVTFALIRDAFQAVRSAH